MVVFFNGILEHVHDAGLPWWATIAATTLGVRGALLPATLVARRASARFVAAAPHLRRVNALLVDALRKDDKSSRVAALYARAVHATLKVHGANPVAAFVLMPAVHIPVFVTFAFAIRELCESAPNFHLEGTLWFPDLAAPDPTLALLAIGGTYFNLGGLPKPSDRPGWPLVARHAAQLGLLAALPITVQLPSGFLVYWLTSTGFTACSIAAFRAIDRNNVDVKNGSSSS
ncbi:hypothetical protein CTAYLR_002852 [Chrysophaeum taylorii]|uniref:Membrane insertase YidC/Oxa/ALB C-terminal domain-containing protein n=1 Tax=Chrysophaeum taylorii TaxID=2483200 RepID=A0AAD7UAD9_9STRA|nr:hypothetical protein CTAYLR_002852 [Chrysophaeum taylorii]